MLGDPVGHEGGGAAKLITGTSLWQMSSAGAPQGRDIVVGLMV